jgi:hypothetical protein
MSDEVNVVRLVGFDDAIIGMAARKGQDDVLAYDVQKMINILMNDNEWDEDEAIEYFYYNIYDAWMGDGTPVLITVNNKVIEDYINDQNASVQLH